MPLPYYVISAACEGDDSALILALEHFDAYISELAMRAARGEHGTTTYGAVLQAGVLDG